MPSIDPMSTKNLTTSYVHFSFKIFYFIQNCIFKINLVPFMTFTIKTGTKLKYNDSNRYQNNGNIIVFYSYIFV